MQRAFPIQMHMLTYITACLPTACMIHFRIMTLRSMKQWQMRSPRQQSLNRDSQRPRPPWATTRRSTSTSWEGSSVQSRVRSRWSLIRLLDMVRLVGTLHAEEVRQGLNYALRHALACTINCILLAITHAYKCSWQLKPRFSHYFAEGSEGLSHSKGLLFEGEYRGAKYRA